MFPIFWPPLSYVIRTNVRREMLGVKGVFEVEGNLFGWGPQSLKQICTTATMGRLECKEKEAYGISGLHLTTQTAQGSILCPSFYFLPLLATASQCRCWSRSDRSSSCCLLFGCRPFAGEKSDQMNELFSVPDVIKYKIAKRIKVSLSQRA